LRQKIGTHLFKLRESSLTDWEHRFPLVNTLKIFEFRVDNPAPQDVAAKIAREIGKDIWFTSFDIFGQRMHSALTNAPKGTRRYLRLVESNELLFEIDLKNAQPFLLAALAELDFQQLHGRISENFDPSHHDAIANYQQNIDAADIQLFRQLAESGELYDEIGSLFPVNWL